MDCRPPGSSVHGIFQARILACLRAKSLQSCPTLFHPLDCSPSGSSVQGILQARILEWVAISSSSESSRPRDQTRVSCGSCIGRWILSPLSQLGSPPSLWQEVNCVEFAHLIPADDPTPLPIGNPTPLSAPEEKFLPDCRVCAQFNLQHMSVSHPG